LQLLVHNREQPMRGLAHELFDDMAPFADMLDTAYGGRHYQGALQDLRSRIDHPESTPSAQVLDAVKTHGGYFNFATAMSKTHTQSLQAVGLDAQLQAKFKTSVQDSLAAQQQVDAVPEGPFVDFVAAYFA
jgi:glutamate--cysteine ligase